MIKRALTLCTVLISSTALAQVVPGPSPFSYAYPDAYFDYGGVMLPRAVTGGSKGPGTINARGVYINGLPAPYLSAVGTAGHCVMFGTNGALSDAGAACGSGGGGSGTVVAGTVNQLAYYPGSAASVSGLNISGLQISGGTLQPTYGTSANTVAQGNDSRITGALQASNNFSDLANSTTARTNLGLAAIAATGNAALLTGGPAPLSVFPAPVVYSFLGDGTTTTFTLSPVVDPTKISVNISGVPQIGWTATSSSITFPAPVPVGAYATVIYGGVAAGLPFFATASPGDSTSNPATTAFVQTAKQFRTFQDFGAAGNGTTDDTTAVQTALNSGYPIACVGKFQLNGLVTSTHLDASIKGFGVGCHFIYNTAQSMIWFNETGASQYATEQITLEDVEVDIASAITAVTGPAHTAAFYISYSSGTSGVAARTVMTRNVKIKPTAASNYILNGIYLNDATNAVMHDTECESERTTFQIGTSCVVIDGTHSPTNIAVDGLYCDFCGIGVYAPQQTATGWQGIRLHDIDCVYCSQIVRLNGALDGLSDQAFVDGSEGAFQDGGISIANATHVDIHDNYVFASDLSIAISGGTHAANPTCYNATWTLAIPSNGAGIGIHDNDCDGTQVTGYTNRYGVIVAGNGGTGMASAVGINQMTNLDIGVSLQSGTAGVTVTRPSTKNVTTPMQNNATAGANSQITPTSY